MTCDSGRLRNGAKGLANAAHRATREPSPSGLGPDGRVSAFAAIYDQLMRPSENVAWLERAGPIAKRLNEESKRD